MTASATTLDIHSGGAQISQWDSARFGSLIFSPKNADYAVGKCPHGGIPICFPWFGVAPDLRTGALAALSENPSAAFSGDHSEAPADSPAGLPDDNEATTPPFLASDAGDAKHGFANLLPWARILGNQDDDGGTATYRLTGEDVPASVALVHPFEAFYQVDHTSETLRLQFRVVNPGPEAFRYETALHTYFRVGDVTQISIEGLEGIEYLNAAPPSPAVETEHVPLRFDGMVDRVYSTPARPRIVDPTLGRAIRIDAENAASTIVWNPGEAASHDLADLSTCEWKQFVCVESGNAHANAVTLAPGEQHAMSVTYSVASA